MRGIASFARWLGRVPWVVYFVGCCVGAGAYLWYVKATSSAFLEAERAACVKKCSPSRAKLETTRQELAHQRPAWRGETYNAPECRCL
jgi:hypothetical protein